MSRKLKNVLVTGGAGFIGSNFINYLLGLSATGSKEFMDSGFTGRIINVDCLTYAGNPDNLSMAVKQKDRYIFEKADICDRKEMERIFRQYDIDTVVHFAAESHVDRSILGPEAFIRTNVTGTFTLLDVPENTGMFLLIINGMMLFFIIFLQMKFMVPLVLTDILQRQLLMIPVLHIPVQRLLQTI